MIISSQLLRYYPNLEPRFKYLTFNINLTLVILVKFL